MVTPGEKINPVVNSRQPQAVGPAFFRKPGENNFFENREAPSFFSGKIQAKLTVSQPNDPQEKEADEMAEHVMRMPEPVHTSVDKKDEEEKIHRSQDTKEEKISKKQADIPLAAHEMKEEEKLQRKEEKEEEHVQRSAGKEIGRQEEQPVHSKAENNTLFSVQCTQEKAEEKIHTKCEACRNDEKKDEQKIHAKPGIVGSTFISRKNISLYHSDVLQLSGRGPPADSIPFEQTLSSSKGGGVALPENTRQFMESRFNADFSGVRIHAGSTAQQLTAGVNAKAFAHGNDIYFNTNKYSPNTASGSTLLAHELTHTIQQGKSEQKNNTKNNFPDKPQQQKAVITAENSIKTPQPLSLNTNKNSEQTNNNATKKSTDKNINDATTETKTTDSKNTSNIKEKPTLTLLMPEPPAELNAASKKRLQQTQHKATKSAAIHANLPPSNKNVEDARATVEEPTEESNAKAGDDLVAALGERPQPSPEIIALCDKIREVIRSKRPPDEDSLVDAEPEGAAKEAGGQLNDNINGNVDKVGKNYDDIKQTPTGTAEKQPEQLTTPPEKVDTPNIDAQNAVPDAIPPADTSLDADVASSEQQIDNAGMNTEPAKLVQNGPIADARNANAELKDTAASDPAAVQAAQKAQLAEAGKDMAALQAKALQALNTSRTTAIKGIGGGQVNMKETEEEKRTRVGGEAQQIFTDAQTHVNELLSPLSADAMKKWGADVDVASKNFKDTLNKVKKWIDDRHSGVGGTLLSIGDWATGLPHWVTEEYDKAEKQFGDDICRSITDISLNVNTIIATCEQLIKKAHADIVDLFKKSFGDLDGWANDQIKNFDKQLDGLQSKVTQTRDQLNKDLAGKASKSVQDVREQVSALRQKAKGMIGRIADAISAFIDDPAKFIIEGLLNLLGIPVAAFWRLVAKIKTVIGQIADDPIGFAGNLMNALSRGFSQFTDNFGKHLLEGIIAWLTSGLGSVGVQLPADFSLPSIITFFLQLMGISWDRIRKLLAKHIGEENVAHIEKAYFLVTGFIEKGPTGIFEMIKEQLDPKTLLDQILNAIVSFVEGELIKRVAIELLKLFNPVGAILKAIEAIYDIFKWVFDNAARIFTLIETIVNGIGDIISGNIAGMATAIEKALTMLIAPIVDFFAELVGLGDLPQKIADLIKGFQDWIEGILDRVIGWLAEKAKALLKKLGIGKEEPKEGDKLDDTETGKTISFTVGTESHKLWVDTSGNLTTVMMASGTPGKLTDKVKEIEDKLPPEEKQTAAQKVAQVQQINTSIVADGTQAKQKIKEAQAEGHSKENTSEAKAADDKVESEEQQLVEPVKQLMLMSKVPEPSPLVKPVDFAKEKHSLKARTTGSLEILMASDEFVELHQEITKLRRVYVEPNEQGVGGHLAKTNQEEAKNTLDQKLRAIIDKKKSILSAANNAKADTAKRDQILEDGLGELQQMVEDMSHYMLDTFNIAFGGATDTALNDIVFVKGPDMGFKVTAVKEIKEGHFGIITESLDKTNKNLFLNYEDHDKTWKKAPSNEPPFYGGFSGSQGTGARTSTHVQKGISFGGEANYDPPGYGGKFNRRGHLVANSFGGPGDSRNIVAMTEAANHTDAGMRSIEKDVDKEVKKGAVFNYKATPDYSGRNWQQDPPVAVNVVADEVWPNPQTSRFSKNVTNS